MLTGQATIVKALPPLLDDFKLSKSLVDKLAAAIMDSKVHFKDAIRASAKQCVDSGVSH